MLDNIIYDLVILGGGPAGLTGGIENYPGFLEDISGYELILGAKRKFPYTD